MPDAVGLIKTVKRTAVEAVRAEKPTEVCFGKVAQIKPLSIIVEQKLILDEKQLVLTRNVTDFTVEMDIGIVTEKNPETDPVPHTHNISGKGTVTVRNGLAVGDEVILLRQQGGQKFIVLERMG